MRETAEWTGRQMSRLMWEPLPLDHPQARPVLARMRDKRRRAAQAARRVRATNEDRANGDRPAWSNAQPLYAKPSGPGIGAAEALARKEQLPRPPATLARPKKK